MNLHLYRTIAGFGWAGQIVAIPAGLEDEAAGLVALQLAQYTTDPVSATPVDPPTYVSHDALAEAIEAIVNGLPALNRGVHPVVVS